MWLEEKEQEKAKNWKCAFFETSALSGVNISQIFEELTNNIYDSTGGNKNDEEFDIEFENDNKGVNLDKDETYTISY